jgi:hypothetical protein
MENGPRRDLVPALSATGMRRGAGILTLPERGVIFYRIELYNEIFLGNTIETRDAQLRRHEFPLRSRWVMMFSMTLPVK